MVQEEDRIMPLIRVSLRKGKPDAYRKAICDSVYQALRETFNVPEEDRFMIVTEHEGEDLDYSRSYLNIERSDDFVVLQLTVSNTRGIGEKQKLYRRIVELLAERPGLRPQDVFINLVEVLPENWSFGNGIAQYV
jgi:phenylpyruvate tautomerase PptA (4-oxalocrotonate tautomerase family)